MSDATDDRHANGRARPRRCTTAAVAALLVSSGGTFAETLEDPARTGGTPRYDVCYDFTCSTSETVTLTARQWATVVEIFRPAAASAKEERRRIQQAVARMEQLSGFHTPTHRDLPRNYTGEDDQLAGLPGQMDCIDESINTSTYLELFEKHRLLSHHRALPRAYRRALFNQHWAGQMEELTTGERYVFDSWFLENGREPYVVHADDWNDLSLFRRRAQTEPEALSVAEIDPEER